MSSLAGTAWRVTALTSGSISLIRAMPSATVFFVPPSSWIVIGTVILWSGICQCSTRDDTWLTSQPRPSTRKPAKFGWFA